MDVLADDQLVDELAKSILGFLSENGFDLARNDVLVMRPEVRSRIWLETELPATGGRAVHVAETHPGFSGLIMGRDD